MNEPDIIRKCSTLVLFNLREEAIGRPYVLVTHNYTIIVCVEKRFELVLGVERRSEFVPSRRISLRQVAIVVVQEYLVSRRGGENLVQSVVSVGNKLVA